MYLDFEPYLACTQALYDGGSRSFLVFNGPPTGCTPYILTLYGGKGGPVDRFGCLSEYNDPMKVYDAQLKASVQEYRTRWSDASFLFFDSYGAIEAILSDLEAYGEKRTIKLKRFLYLQVTTQSRRLLCAASEFFRNLISYWFVFVALFFRIPKRQSTRSVLWLWRPTQLQPFS